MLMEIEELLNDMEYSYDKGHIYYSGFRVKIFPDDLQKKEIFAIFDACDWCYNKAIDIFNEHCSEKISWTKMNKLVKDELKQNEQHKHLTDNIMKYTTKSFYEALNYMKYGKGFPVKKPSEKNIVRTFQFRTDGMRIGEHFVKVEHVSGEIRIGYNHIPLKTHAANAKQDHLTYYRARISYDGIDFWFSVNIEYPHEIITLFKKTPEKTDPIGIDVGMRISAMCSNGWKFHTPMDEKRVKRVSKLDSKIAKKHKIPAMTLSEETGIPYKEIPKSNKTLKLERKRLEYLRKTSNIKDSAIHEFTTKLVRENPRAIVMEKFSVEDMCRGKSSKFCKELYAQCLYKIKQYILYKCRRSAIPFVTADGQYPSTRRCSNCGNMDPNYVTVDNYRDRKFHCHKCGFVANRDFNAACNLRDIVLDPKLYKYIFRIDYKGHTFKRKLPENNKE